MDQAIKLAGSDNEQAIPIAPLGSQVIQLTRSKNYHTLTLETPVAVGREPGDYDGLSNKPSINGVVLQGNLTWQDLGLPDYGDIPKQPLSNEELNQITNGKE